MLPYLPKISKIFIEKDSYNNFQLNNIEKIIERINSINLQNNENIPEINYLPIDEINRINAPLNKIEEKKNYNLIIQKNPGIYIKKCPGTPNYICCNYFITTFYVNCNLNCTYCFLRFYLKTNNLIIYYDIDNFFHELDNYKKLRLGSGELSDSLLFDPFTEYSKLILGFLKDKDSIIFEFKTKTTYIEPFLNEKPMDNIIIGFSMNPETIATNFEPFASTPKQRLEAAKLLADNGWRISFHFDPIIFSNEYNKEDYIDLFKSIIEIPDKSIAWFSLGSLRYHQDMIPILRENEKGKKLLNYELIKGLDGKIRYFIEDRISIYKKIVDIYLKNKRNFPLYYCMESDKVYLNTFMKLPNKIDNLKDIFTFNK